MQAKKYTGNKKSPKPNENIAKATKKLQAAVK